MSYDRDSFLAGLAVGRTLWRPHTLAPGVPFGAYPCFLCGSPVEVQYTFTKNGETYEARSLDIRKLDESSESYPSPAYWMLCNKQPYQRLEWVVFSTDAHWINDHGTETGLYGVADGDEVRLMSLIAWFTTIGTGDIKYELDNSFPNGSVVVDASQIFSQIPYITITELGLREFLAGARIVQTPSGYFVAGEIPS